MKIEVDRGQANGEAVARKLRELARDYDPWGWATLLRSAVFWLGVCGGVLASAVVNVTDLHIRVCLASECVATVISPAK